jgi:hypothetical protein
MTPFADRWSYDNGLDPAIWLFTNALRAWRFEIQPGMRVLELGCCETDFAARLKACVPDLYVVGMDVRDPGQYGGDDVVICDASAPKALEDPRTLAGTFDWVISLGAVEHFGLGWYGDPKNQLADTVAMWNVAYWLKRGGSVYFDVPWTPRAHHETAHYRVYSDLTLSERFTTPVTWVARGWTRNERERDEFTQVRPLTEWTPFWYIAQWGVKA